MSTDLLQSMRIKGAHQGINKYKELQVQQRDQKAELDRQQALLSEIVVTPVYDPDPAYDMPEAKALNLSPFKRLSSSYDSNVSNDYQYRKAVHEGYRNLDVVFSAIDIVAGDFSTVPLRVKVPKRSGTLMAAPAHELNRLLHTPNVFQQQDAWMFSNAAYRLLGGVAPNFINTGLNGQADMNGRPLQIMPLPPDAVTFDVCNNSTRTDWKYRINANENFVPQMDVPFDFVTGRSNMIWWNTFNPLCIAHGQSPLMAANINMEIYTAGNIWNRTFFQNGCRHSLILTTTGERPLADEEVRRIKKSLREQHSGAGKNDGVLFLEGIKAQQVSSTIKDADFVMSHDQQARDIARVFGVPPILLNIAGDTTFSNQKDARLALWEDTIIPMVENFVRELNKDLAYRYRDNPVIVPDFSNVSALEPRREAAWKRANESRELTLNEKRELKGYDPLEGEVGGAILVPSNMINAEDAVSGKFLSQGGGSDVTGSSTEDPEATPEEGEG